MIDPSRVVPVLVTAAVCCAAFAGAGTKAPDPVQATLVCESTALVPGTVAQLGVLFRIDPGWHLFWDGCNATGYPIAIKPELPDGFAAQPVEWPAPKRLVSPGDIVDHVYEGSVLLIVPVEIPAGLTPGTSVTLRASLEWVSCREACLVGDADVELALPIAAPATGTKPSTHAPLFAEARARLPRPAPEGEAPFQMRWRAGTLVVESDAASSMSFFPQSACASLEDPVADGSPRTRRLVIRYHPVDGQIGPVRGVLEFVGRDGAPPQYFNLEVPTADERASQTPAHP